MEKRVLLIADVRNLFYTVARHFGGKKIDYEKLLGTVKKQGILVRACAFGIQKENEAAPFIDLLRAVGFEPFYKSSKFPHTNWGAGMAVEAARMLERVDTVVLATADLDMLPLVYYIRDRGVECVLLGVIKNPEMRHAANRIIDINDEMLEPSDVKVAAES
jgi:uncharacterized LabA/DUF88 family protein